MLRVVALRALPMPGQWPVRSFPGLGIDERGHVDRHPCGWGALRAALAIAGLMILEPAPPLRPLAIVRLGALVVGFPFRDGVAQDRDNTARSIYHNL